ncbi:MAG: hypothetical protein K2L05_02135 [Muribaculaceae bacterium]|nr:hypothetical protein [Muribaculaceae bacterium]
MKTKTIALMAVLCLSAACSSKKEVVEPASVPMTAIRPVQPGAGVNALPKAIVYRMSGNATAANVPVNVNPQTGDIVSFPGPGDVVGQEPIELEGGWLLDRRGISENSRFTKWTYAEYAAMKTPPTLAEIKAAIIPDARAIDLHRLSMTPSEAAADLPAVVKALPRK